MEKGIRGIDYRSEMLKKYANVSQAVAITFVALLPSIVVKFNKI